MDKLKSFIQQKEEHLNIEQVSDNVWMQIDEALKNSISENSVLQKNKYNLLNWLRSYMMSYPRWALALIIPLLFIISCTYRVKSIEPVGNIITINVAVGNRTAIQRINSLKILLALNLEEARNVQVQIRSFVGFLKREETFKVKAIQSRIRPLSPTVTFGIIPVEKTISESLFSRLVYKLFDKHIDAKQSSFNDLDKNITKQLKSNGIENITVQQREGNDEIVISVQRQPIQQLPKDTISANNVRDPVGSVKNLLNSADTVRKKSTRINNIAKKDNKDHLNGFKWLLHSWRTIDSSQNTYHKWIKINDSLYRSFLLRLELNSPIYQGYSLYKKKESTFLEKENNTWLLTEATNNNFLFERKLQEFPHKVLWVLSNKGWQFNLIRSLLKDQVYLYVDDSHNRELDSILNRYKKKNPQAF